MTQTHTYVILEISQAAYAEIRASLEKAGYQHAFRKDIDGREVIDMQGLAVATERVPLVKTIIVNGVERLFSGYEISYEQLVELAYPMMEAWDGWTAVFHAKLSSGSELNGSLFKGKTVTVFEGMSFSVANTSDA